MVFLQTFKEAFENFNPAGHFLRSLGFDYEPAIFMDTASHLHQPLKELHGEANCRHFCLGESGDITTIPPSHFGRVDGLVSGPPCPPFSSIGQRLAEADERAEVFRAVHNHICYQGSLGMFFFVIEMVMGQDASRSVGGVRQPSFYEDWIHQLSLEAPMFLVSSFPLNTQEYGLPQCRPRIYTVGVHRALTRQPAPRPPPIHYDKSAAWHQILHPAIEKNREFALTPQQRINLAVCKGVASRKAWTNPICLSLDRDPTKAWGGMCRYDGVVSTLRTGNEMLWLLEMQPAPRKVLQDHFPFYLILESGPTF